MNPKDVLLTQIGAFGDPGRWEWLAGGAACGRRHMALLLGCFHHQMLPALMLLVCSRATAVFCGDLSEGLALCLFRLSATAACDFEEHSLGPAHRFSACMYEHLSSVSCKSA